MTKPYSLSSATAHCNQTISLRQNGVPSASAKPVIGITTNLGSKGAELACGYFESVRRAGGTPLLLPPTNDDAEILDQLEQLDGLLLSGGGDINPLWVGEDPIPELHSICPERDGYELLLCRMAHRRNIPVMGICRGCQVMAVALGGSVAQDISVHLAATGASSPIKHSQDAPRTETTHRITITDHNGVFREMGNAWAVNSFHHQAVTEPGPLMHVSAVASDGVIEAMEGNDGESFLLGVQWHPECLASDGFLFDHLVEAASVYCRALELHASITTLDSHCDTPMMFATMIQAEEEATGTTIDKNTWMPNLATRNPHCLVDQIKATEGHLDETYMVSYIPQGARTEEGYREARQQVELTRRRLDHILHGAMPGLYVHFGIENGYAIGKDISLIAHYKEQLGVEYITLCHNGHNDICDSARPRQDEPQQEWGGLSPFGREVVKEMNRQGVLIDLSHAAESTFYDVLNCSQKPVAVTHACCRALCDHPRNLTDDQLRAIAEKDGVVQCTMYPYFLRADGQATIHDYMAHLEHMIQVCGIDHVGIGTDFDGDGGVPGLRDASDLFHITEQLIEMGYGDDDICKIWGDNFRRVMAQQQV